MRPANIFLQQSQALCGILAAHHRDVRAVATTSVFRSGLHYEIKAFYIERPSRFAGVVMSDLLPSLVLVGASAGIATVLGTLVWCWVKWSQPRRQKQYRKY